MLVKILLVVVIAAGIYLLGRFHGRRTQPPPLPMVTLSKNTAKFRSTKSRLLFTLLMLLIPLALMGMVYLHWQDERQVMRVKVIHAGTGQTLLYQARRSAIQLRSFQELDGRRIILSDQERMEVEPQTTP